MSEPPLTDSPLVVIAGPTGSGKSSLALRIARRFRAEIVNCDSVQVFRHFNIGTAKIPQSERQGIPHHLLDALEPDQVFTAGDFCRIGRMVLRDIAGRGSLPLVTGGTGFYLRALLEGLAPGPPRDAALRTRLAGREQRHPGSLHRLLRRFDASTASRIHVNDTPKVMRALEICLTTRQPATAVFSAGRDALTGFRVLKIALFPDREALYSRLDARLDAMFENGLVEEVREILALGFPTTVKGFESIGYKQALQVVRGELSHKDGLFYAKRDTRRYSKRQMTWLRQEPHLRAFRGFGDDERVAAEVEQCVAEFLR